MKDRRKITHVIDPDHPVRSVCGLDSRASLVAMAPAGASGFARWCRACTSRLEARHAEKQLGPPTESIARLVRLVQRDTFAVGTDREAAAIVEAWLVSKGVQVWP